MIGLDRLMERKGVIAAGQFSPDGSVVRGVGDLSKEEMEHVAHTCMIHDWQVRETTAKLDVDTNLNWRDLSGWIIWAGRYALCVSGDTGVFVQASKADFNQLMVDLFGPPAGGLPLH